MSIFGEIQKSIQKQVENILCNSQPVVDLLQFNSTVRSYVNTQLINMAIAKAPPRPYPLSTLSNYTSWDSLTDRTYSGRHLPPVSKDEVDKLPDIEKDVLPLFKRPKSGMRPCKKSTVLFSYFAQWFTDAFLRTTRQQGNLEYDEKLRNTSPHDVNLSNLYGLKWNVFGQPKNDVQYLRSTQGGTLKSQEINGEEYPPYYYDENGQPKDEFKPLSMTDLNPIFIMMMSRDPLDEKLFAMGGDRLNTQTGFVALNTLFLREHNRICGLLREKYPQWDNERLFQTARNINIGVMAKVAIEEYINHISPFLFEFRLEPGRFERQNWYRTNWMTIEFNLLYRWHSLVPDKYWMRCAPESPEPHLEVPVEEALFNNRLLTDRGLGGVLEDASRQPAGEIGLFNTTEWLLRFEQKSLLLGRLARLPGYNAYRELTGRRPARDFAEISNDEFICRRLKDVYKTVDQVEFYTGIFAEPVIANSALAELTGDLVAIDAFSQALTNPLLSARIFKKETFTEVGMDVIASTTCLSDILHRNLPGKGQQYYLSMTRKNEKLLGGKPVAGASAAIASAREPAGAMGSGA
jgi:prostaglandin-endoperoxide synthase 2